ncbi:MAG: DUF1992 domain-containing protein [Desulfobacterales bacterium]|nr:DUF1992 domain-containing protein [Desulfobacterales bacterium]
MKNKKENKNLGKPLSKENARSKYKLLLSEKENRSADTFENLVEAKIKKAMDEGAFKNLQGKGKPIDLSKYYGMPEHLRLGYQILKNAGYIPEEVRLKKEMELIKEKMRKCRSEKSKSKLMKELSEISQQFNFYMEYNKKFK